MLPPTVIIVIVVVVIIIIIAIVIPIVLLKKKSTNSKLVTNKQLINTALKRAGITILNQEGFDNNSEFTFTTIDSIMNNFSLFIETYYPSLDINKINELTMKYGNGKTIDQIIASHPGIDYYKFLIAGTDIVSNFVVNSSINNSDLILAGISKILIEVLKNFY